MREFKRSFLVCSAALLLLSAGGCANKKLVSKVEEKFSCAQRFALAQSQKLSFFGEAIVKLSGEEVEDVAFRLRFKLKEPEQIFLEMRNFGVLISQIAVRGEQMLIYWPREKKYWEGNVKKGTKKMWRVSLSTSELVRLLTDLWPLPGAPEVYLQEKSGVKNTFKSKNEAMGGRVELEVARADCVPIRASNLYGHAYQYEWNGRVGLSKGIEIPRSLKIKRASDVVEWTLQGVAKKSFKAEDFQLRIPKQIEKIE